MKNAIIFHGTDCSPENSFYWYKWLKNELESRDYSVHTPHYPIINHEELEGFLPKVLDDIDINSDTVLIGHSAGAPLVLSVLEKLTAGQIRLSILVAGYSMRLEGQPKDPILQSAYDWQKIKQNSKDFVFINSVNDPWGCDDKQGRIMFDQLGGTQIIKNEGHFGSESQNLPYIEFPLLRDIILGAK